MLFNKLLGKRRRRMKTGIGIRIEVRVETFLQRELIPSGDKKASDLIYGSSPVTSLYLNFNTCEKEEIIFLCFSLLWLLWG